MTSRRPSPRADERTPRDVHGFLGEGVVEDVAASLVTLPVDRAVISIRMNGGADACIIVPVTIR